MDEKDSTRPAFKPLDIQKLQQDLRTLSFGTGEKLLYLPVTDSTSTQAARLAFQGAEEGTTVLADTQTAGRGSPGRRWLDQPGQNILLSIILYPLFPPYTLIKIASLAVVDAIRELCQLSPTIKWPNDTLIGTRKVSGILIETKQISDSQAVTILGIGVNVNGHMQKWSRELQDQAPLLATATTLETECGQPVNREQFICHLLHALELSYLALQHEARSGGSQTAHTLHQRWRSQLSTLGHDIRVRRRGEILTGRAEDVNSQGELLLRSPSGEVAVIRWGEVGFPQS